ERFPLVQHVGQLLYEARQVSDAVEQALPQTDDLPAVAVVEQHVRANFTAIAAVVAELAGRLRADTERAALARIKEEFADLQAEIFGPASLLDGQRQALAARAEVTGGQVTLDQLAARY